MKRTVSMMATAIAIFTCSVNLTAQPAGGQRLSREELAGKQARHISHELALDDATAEKYVATYMAYQNELWALGPRVHRSHGKEATEAESEQANKARLEQSRKIVALREKYYKEYSKFMTQKQIERACELERQLMRRLARHHKDSAGNKGRRHFKRKH